MPVPLLNLTSDLAVALTLPHYRTISTNVGPIYLQDRCSASFVQRLTCDEGLHAFARRAEYEHALLVRLAMREDSRLSLAYTPTGKIIAQVSLAPPDTWWQDIPNVREMAIEVSTNWRHQGLGKQLMNLALSRAAMEQMIILGIGLVWHWDLRSNGLSPFAYRAMLARAASTYGFVEYMTSEPNIREDPANILLVRIGKQVTPEVLNQFYARLLSSDTLPGF